MPEPHHPCSSGSSQGFTWARSMATTRLALVKRLLVTQTTPNRKLAHEGCDSMNEAVDQLDRTVRAAITAVMDADEHTVHAALGELASAGSLGEPTVCFLAQARVGTLAMTICLANVLG